MRDELAEVLIDPKAVIVVEWAALVADVLPADRLTITIKTTGETDREFELQYPSKLQYLIPENT